MFSPRQRSEVMRLFGKRALMFGLFIIVVAAGWSVWGVYRKDRESAALKRQALVQLADLKKRETQLSADISKLQTNRGMEEALREQYALAAQGEHLVIIVDAEVPQPIQATSSVFQWIRKAFWW